MVNKKTKKGTIIHGIAASEHIDSSGERIEIKGIDISSLTIEGLLNFEHKSDQASQIVGKILTAKKIYKHSDCENDHQRYFWDKIKTPYLYITGELFDAVGHQGAKDVAAMLRYDSSRKRDPEERRLINFSIEGQKLDKRGSTIKKCIARKISITSVPCNKVCEAEEFKNHKDLEKSDRFYVTQNLLKVKNSTKTSTCQILKAEFVPKRTFTPQKAPETMKVGDRIDYTGQKRAKSGKDIYGTPPKFNNQGRQISAGAPPKETAETPASNTPSQTPSESPNKSKLSLVPGPKFASTNRNYSVMKSNMRKAIVASVGVGAPSTRVNDLSKEQLNSKMESTCEPKIDLKKPNNNVIKAKIDSKLDPEDRNRARSERKSKGASMGYTGKDASARSKMREKMKKSKEYQGKNKRPGTFFPGSMEKSEAKQILNFVEKKYPQMSKSEQLALAKTVSFIRKTEKLNGRNK